MNVKVNYVPAERQEMIVQYVKQHGSAQIKPLSDWLDVSEATVRRDLDELSASGYLERTHGGAISRKSGTSFERQYDEKLTLMEPEKRKIAQAALQFIEPGDTLFLDSGTTCYYLGCALEDIPNLTVFTYDLMNAYSASLHMTSTLILSGGIRRPAFNNVLIGSSVTDFLRQLRFDKVFLGADAVDVNYGVSNSNYPEAEIKQHALEAGQKAILLTDSSKFGKVALSRVCGFDQIDTLITDSNIDRQDLQELSKHMETIVV